MRAVELRNRLPSGDVETLARIYVSEPGGPARIEPTSAANLPMIESILDRGGVVDRLGRPLRPADGAAYLRALPQSFRGSRLWAEEVEFDETDPDQAGPRR